MNKREKMVLVIILVVVFIIIAFIICFVVDNKLSAIKEQRDLEKFNSDIKNITKVEIYESDNQKEAIIIIEEEDIIMSIINAIENGKYHKLPKTVPVEVRTASGCSFLNYSVKFLINRKVIAVGSYKYGSKELVLSGFKYKMESLIFDELVKPYVTEQKNNLQLAFEIFLDKNEHYKENIEFYEISDQCSIQVKYKAGFSQEEIMDMAQKVSEEIPEISSFISIPNDEDTK